MQIHGNNPFKLLGAYLRAVREVKKPAVTTPSSATPTTDRVQISDKAQELLRLSEMVASGPDIRPDRVAEVEQKIAEGKQPATENEIAESLTKAAMLDRVL